MPLCHTHPDFNLRSDYTIPDQTCTTQVVHANIPSLDFRVTGKLMCKVQYLAHGKYMFLCLYEGFPGHAHPPSL
jgi:hypothetical protein